MKRIRIEEEIRNTYKPTINNMNIKIDLANYDINLYEKESRKFTFQKRFALRTLLVFLMFGIIVAMVKGSLDNSQQTVLATSQDIVAFQAVSSTDLLVQAALNQATGMAFNGPNGFINLGTTYNSEVESELGTLNEYMNMIEQFLATKSELNVVLLTSDNPNYQHKMIYQGYDLSGKAISYSFYYNEIDITNGAPHAFQFNDQDSDKATVLLEGTMTVLNKTYLLEGKQIFINNEEIYSLYSYIDKNNYVYVRYETDVTDGKKKFFYNIVQDGITQNRSKILISNQNDKLVTDLEFEKNGTTGNYHIVRGDNGNSSSVLINYEIQKANENSESGFINVQISIDPVTQNTSYIYVVKPDDSEQEHSYEAERKDSFDEHDDDEDEKSDTQQNPDDSGEIDDDDDDGGIDD